VEPLESIRAQIGDFAGYEDIEQRRVADEQIRAFVGERLAELPAAVVDALSPEERARYDRILLRSEFLNQPAFRVFEENPTPKRVAALLEADAQVLAAAKELENVQPDAIGDVLKRLEAPFDRRDAAMTQA
jgi:hypothetical protein